MPLNHKTIKLIAVSVLLLTAQSAPLLRCNASVEASTSSNNGHSDNSNSDRTGHIKPANESAHTQQAAGHNFTTGSDFKTGPVTDDEKLLKPVAKDAKNPVDSEGSKVSPEAAPDSKKPSENGKIMPGTTTSTSGGGKRKKNASIPDDGDAIETSPKKNFDVMIDGRGPISIGAVKVAKDLDMYDELLELIQLKRDHVYVPGKRVHSLEVIAVRQDLDENLLSAFMATRRVASELDRQVSGYDAVARVLEEKRDQAIRNNNILNFTTGGALAVTQGAISVGTPMKYQNAGNELGVIAGAMTAMIGAYALKIQKGGKRSSERDPNMLAPIFGLVPNEPNKYPKLVWDYLNDYEPEQKKTRREQLIDRWVKLNYIEPLNDKKSQKQLQEVAGTIPLHKSVNIDLLRNRIPMLQDVRAAVAGINEYLDEILTFVRQP